MPLKSLFPRIWEIHSNKLIRSAITAELSEKRKNLGRPAKNTMYVCVCVRELASHRDCRIVPIHYAFTDGRYVLRSAFRRKILIEEDGCSSSGRIWVAAVILTVYNETPSRGASRRCVERKDYHGELDSASRIVIYITRNGRRERKRENITSAHSNEFTNGTPSLPM